MAARHDVKKKKKEKEKRRYWPMGSTRREIKIKCARAYLTNFKGQRRGKFNRRFVSKIKLIRGYLS